MLREDPTQLRLRVDKLIEQARTQETKDFWRAFGRFLDVAVNRTK